MVARVCLTCDSFFSNLIVQSTLVRLFPLFFSLPVNTDSTISFGELFILAIGAYENDIESIDISLQGSEPTTVRNLPLNYHI